LILLQGDKVDIFGMAEMPISMNFVILPPITEKIVNFTLSHPNVRQIMNEEFDAIFIEIFIMEALFGELKLQMQLKPIDFFLKDSAITLIAQSSESQRLELQFGQTC